MRENHIEKKLKTEVEKRGGLCIKFTSPNTNGMPDRIVILPQARIAFIEAKAPGGKPRPIQIYQHQQLKKRGAKVYIVDHPNQITGVLDDIQKS